MKKVLLKIWLYVLPVALTTLAVLILAQAQEFPLVLKVIGLAFTTYIYIYSIAMARRVEKQIIDFKPSSVEVTMTLIFVFVLLIGAILSRGHFGKLTGLLAATGICLGSIAGISRRALLPQSELTNS